jgi:hypothetical protein
VREACLLQFQAKKKMVNMREPFLREDLEAGEEKKERKGLRGCSG